MVDYKDLRKFVEDRTDAVVRADIRVDPSSPEESPYLVIRVHYRYPLNQANQDTNPIVKIEKDNHRFDDYSMLEPLFKERSEDPFDPKGRSLNGKQPYWILKSEFLRYHITNPRMLSQAKDDGIEIVNMSPSLSFPKDNAGKTEE